MKLKIGDRVKIWPHMLKIVKYKFDGSVGKITDIQPCHHTCLGCPGKIGFDGGEVYCFRYRNRFPFDVINSNQRFIDHKNKLLT